MSLNNKVCHLGAVVCSVLILNSIMVYNDARIITSNMRIASGLLGQHVSDICDWSGSGSLTVDSDRSIVPIYLRCSRGSVKWLYPTGGLRVVLKHGTNDNNFHGCIRVARNSSRNVRIYIEGKRQLHQIYSFDDGKHEDLFRCFVSINSFIALFIETESNSLYMNDHVIFNYDLESIKNSSLEDDYDGCKPCDDEQTLSLFCSADFVLSGKIMYFHDKPEVETTEFTVRPTYIYRFPIDDAYLNDFNATFQHSENDVNQDLIGQLSQINLHRHLKCASRAGPKTEFLFLGRKMLGKYFITCAPKLYNWRQISKRAVKKGINQCHITR